MGTTETNNEMIHTTDEMKSEIVCPLCLKIAIESKGRLGTIQSYRCAPRTNIGGWETRPQAKSDKWTADFFRVLHGPRGEEITLSDGETKMKGLGLSAETKSFHFTHRLGVQAKDTAIQQVTQGKLRAPRNWDRTFADEAGITLDELKKTYPEMYSSGTSTRTSSRTQEPVEMVDEGFFEDEERPNIKGQQLDEEDEALIAEEEEAFAETQEPSYSSLAELDLEEELQPMPTKASKTKHKHIKIQRPPTGLTTTLHKACKAFKVEMEDGDYIMFYRVMNPDTQEDIWLHEGQNGDYSDFILSVE